MTTDRYAEALAPLADSLGWQVRFFTREEELVAVAALDHDPSFEQALWIFDTRRSTLRCMLVSRAVVPREREAAILELCARINDGLVFGCAEYSFDDRTVIFRDSADLEDGVLSELVASASARMLDLGSRYSSAIRATLSGTDPADAVKSAESAKHERPQITEAGDGPDA